MCIYSSLASRDLDLFFHDWGVVGNILNCWGTVELISDRLKSFLRKGAKRSMHSLSRFVGKGQGRRNHGDKGGSCPPCLFGKGGKGGRSAFPLKI